MNDLEMKCLMFVGSVTNGVGNEEVRRRAAELSGSESVEMDWSR